jgi:acetyl-CoA carboxylase carboxyl transferase subunit beta
LATAVGNEVWMLENALYSVLSPEGYAAIIWKDSSRAMEAAEIMKMTAQDLKEQHIIEKILPEYGAADMKLVSSISGCMKEEIIVFLKKYSQFTPEQIAARRYTRFRKF